VARRAHQDILVCMSFIRLAMFSSLLNLVVDFWVQSFRLQSNGQSN
jgi:hypothetical protein